MRLMSRATRTFVALGRMMGVVLKQRGIPNRGLAVGTQATGVQQPAGEALILRDDAGLYFSIPLEVLTGAAVPPEAAAKLEQDLPIDGLRFPIHSSRFGRLEFLGVSSQTLILRDSLGGYYAIPPDVLRAARVPPEGTAKLEEQLSLTRQPFRFDSALLGQLQFIGSFQILYVPDAQDAPSPLTSPLADEHQPAAASAHAEMAEARDAFSRNGWCTLSGGAFSHRLATLVGEAEGLVRAASREYEIASEDNLSIRMKRYATSGPVLSSVHHDVAVLSTLRALIGTLVVPTQAAYYFYSGDDYISPHTDASHCPLAVLVRVFGDPPPLMIYPELRGCAPEKLLALADPTGGHPKTGEPMRFPYDGAIVFEGCELPHHRPPGMSDSGFVGVAQLCYRSVWSQTRPPRRMVADRPLTTARRRWSRRAEPGRR